MTDIEIIEKINTSLAEEFELDSDEMTPEAHLFENLGLDSLDLVDMVVVLEGAFNFKIREEDGIRSIRTLGDIHQFVSTKMAQLEQKIA